MLDRIIREIVRNTELHKLSNEMLEPSAIIFLTSRLEKLINNEWCSKQSCKIYN